MAYLISGEKFTPMCDFCGGSLDEAWIWAGSERACSDCQHHGEDGVDSLHTAINRLADATGHKRVEDILK